MASNNQNTDCLIIGNNQMLFVDYVDYMRSMGETSGAFRDVNLSYYTDQGIVCSAKDYYNRYYKESTGLDMSFDNIFSATISYLGTFLHKHNLSFRYINSFQEEKDCLKDLLISGKILTIAITSTYYVSSIPILDIINYIKKYNTEAKIIIGGPYLTTQFEILDDESFQFLLKQLGADFYVKSSQGETALVEIIKSLKNGSGLGNIKNVFFRNGIDYFSNGFSIEDNKLEENIVDWNLFKDEFQKNKRKMVMVRSVISCPFSCSFCSFPSHAGKYKYLGDEHFFQELDGIREIGEINSVTFIDDTFNVPIKRFRRILDVFVKRDYNFKWNCNYRCQYASEEDVARMKEAGCEGVFLGIESGSNTILKNMNKKSRAEDYQKGIELLKKYGILTYASFIIGFPGETDETIQDTIDLIETAQPDFFRAQLWYYDTMTPIYKRSQEFGLCNSQFEWKHNTMDSNRAADWVDYMHENIKNSVWLPQNDFDYPSIFNLLSRGWSMEEIKAMLRSFNGKVRAKVSNNNSLQAGVGATGDAFSAVDFAF